MPNTYTLIASNTVGGAGASSITFSSIPGTYTDLLITCSVRMNASSSPFYLYFNANASNYADKRLTGNGSAASSSSSSSARLGNYNGTDTTANTFSSHSIYIPNYASSNFKCVSVDATSENNGTTAFSQFLSDLWQNTAAITSIKLEEGSASFVQYSTFYLYGISKS